jgi:uroporphyrinogen-III decarboxylase
MKLKERILNTLNNKDVDQLPYLPRLDIWYNANKFNGTLPGNYKNATLKEITEDLGLGYHYVIPDYKMFDGPDRDVDIGLGHYRFNTKPYRLDFHNVKREIEHSKDGFTHIRYITPIGEVSTAYHYDERSKAMGLTLNTIVEHAIKKDEDYETIAYIFENCEVVPTYDYYAKFKEEVVGENGVCVGYSLVWASPMHYISKDLMNYEFFCMELFDNEDKLLWLSDKMAPFFDKVFEVAANSPAEVILSGCNYDVSLTPPSFFKKHITPWLSKQSKTLHNMGKYLITHPDGENNGLLQEYVDAEIDIADSICPAPLTQLTLKDVLKVFGEKITIWGGVPSTIFIEELVSDDEFEEFLDMTMETIGNGRKIILGIADTLPPVAKFARVLRVAEKARSFGAVKY